MVTSQQSAGDQDDPFAVAVFALQLWRLSGTIESDTGSHIILRYV